METTVILVKLRAGVFFFKEINNFNLLLMPCQMKITILEIYISKSRTKVYVISSLIWFILETNIEYVQ